MLLFAQTPRRGSLWSIGITRTVPAIGMQSWTHPVTKQTHTWTERVLVARSSADQAGLRRRRTRRLARLTEDLTKLWQPPGRGRKRYHSQSELARMVAER